MARVAAQGLLEPGVIGDTIRTIRGCARCTKDHECLTFKTLIRPMVDLAVIIDDHPRVIATHWAACPTNGDPIMMRYKDEMDRA